MNYFKQHNKNKKPNTIDGFIPRNNANSADFQVASKFRKSYRPEESTSSVEGFTSRRDAVSFSDTTSRSTESFSVDSFSGSQADEPSQKKRFGRRKKHSSSRKHKRLTFKKVAKSFAIFLVATVIGVTSLFGYGYLKARNIFKGDGEGAAALQKDVDPAKLNGEGDGRVNVLLIGKGGPGHEAPDLTDTLLLASIDPIQNEASLVSVPRDLYVKDANSYSTKVNAVYSNAKQARLAKGNDSSSDEEAAEKAGLNAIKDTVSEVLGVPVHYYVMVDFAAFEEAINTVGGITIDVQEPLYDQSVAHLLNGNSLVAAEGLQTFDGKRALLYARSRKGSARGDFDRTERQREIIVALQSKIFSLGTFSNPFKVVELLNTFGNSVRTDLNGLEEIKRLYEIGQNIGPDRIGSVGLADPPNMLVTTDFIAGQSVVVPTAGLYQYDEIHSYIRNTLRDAFLKSEDARVVILNGTEIVGLATARSDELKSYGYNVTSVDNAPTGDYTSTVIIDNTNGKMRYTRSYLERRLGVLASSEKIEGLPDISQADFVIILGINEAN